jgi:hypothetical protein
MTDEFESRLQRMFAEAEVNMPAADFAARIGADLRKSRRRERLVRCSRWLTALALAWLSLQLLMPALGALGASVTMLPGVITDSVVALSRSPLVYVYGAALGGYLLLRLAGRFHLRLL